MPEQIKWWGKPRDLLAEALYPNNPTASDDKTPTAREKRRAEQFHAKRGFCSPLGGQAVESKPSHKGKK